MRAIGARRQDCHESRSRNQQGQKAAHDAQHDGAKKCRPKAGYEKSRHEGGGKFKHQSVDDEPKKPESKYGQRKSKDFQKEADRRIDQADDNGRDQRGAKAAHLDAGEEKRDNHQTCSADEPMK